MNSDESPTTSETSGNLRATYWRSLISCVSRPATIAIPFLMVALLFGSACSGQSASDDGATSEATSQAGAAEENEDPTGTYKYENSNASVELTVGSSTWYATTTMKSGFGAEYDASEAMRSNGIVKGTDLYDESGYVKVGNVWKNANKQWAADVSIGGQSLTLFME